jgi:hypothetical protein
VTAFGPGDAHLARHSYGARAQRALRPLLALQLRDDCGVELLPHARHRQEAQRPHLREDLGHRGQVPDEAHVRRRVLRGVEGEDPFGDVRERQIGDHPGPSPACDSTAPFGGPVVPEV